MNLSIFIGFSVSLFQGTTTSATTTAERRNFRGSLANENAKDEQQQQQDRRSVQQLTSNVFESDFIIPSKGEKQGFKLPDTELRGSDQVDTRIVGGSSSEVGAFPYFVDVLQAGCGGTLIAPQIILTAHHCDKENVKFKGRDVMIGAYDKDEWTNGTIRAEVEDQTGHPGYDPDEGHRQAYDFLLIKLKDPVDISEPRASIVEEPGTVDTTPAGEMLRVIGLGRLSYDGDRTDTLQDVEVPVVDFQECQDLYSDDSKEVEPDIMFCAGDTEDGGIDSCSGDSGGPIVLEKNETVHVLKGVVSWGKGCADEDYPGVYAKVSACYDWIQEIACGEWNVEADFCEGYQPITEEWDDTEEESRENEDLPACNPVTDWESEYGTCGTYADAVYNHEYCEEDVDENGILAKDACPECGACVVDRRVR